MPKMCLFLSYNLVLDLTQPPKISLWSENYPTLPCVVPLQLIF